MNKPLTAYVPAGGCACKVDATLLRDALQGVAYPSSPSVLVDMEGADDAGVFALSEDMALVQTVDFFHPMVDDPATFGAIAAANSVSDVYAMGGVPVTAMNVVGFPVELIQDGTLQSVLQGAASVLGDCGVSVVGGHTISLDAPVFGVSVTGTVHPKRLWRNTGAQQGDALILTKPLGTGALMTARKGQLFMDESEMAIASMKTTNRMAATVAKDFTVHACTDVTGFGLVGHALEMIGESPISFHLSFEDIPVFPGALDAVSMGLVPAATYANAKQLSAVKTSLHTAALDVLCDPQTSGGLLFAVPGDEGDSFVEALRDAGVTAATRIGTVEVQERWKVYV